MSFIESVTTSPISHVGSTIISPAIQDERVSTPDKEMKQLGISSQYEYERFQQVSAVAGHDIAAREVGRNLAAYEREFLQDIPISQPHDYYHINGELFSEDIQNPLFRIQSQIDSREREGRTLRGFQIFEKMLIDPDISHGVFAWYSPAGKAGSTPPFSEITFDAGRLYVALKNDNGSSTHIDLKINEQQFPIRELLNWMNYCAEGAMIPDEVSLEDFGGHFLEHPIDTKMNRQEFMAFLKDFIQSHSPEQIAYVARRNSQNPDGFSLGRMYEEMESQLLDHYARNIKPEWVAQSNYSAPTNDFSEVHIQRMYMAAIQDYAKQNGGRVELYGCSTTSSFDLLKGFDTGFSSYFGQVFRYSSWDRIVNGDTSMQLVGSEESKNVCVTCPYCNNKEGNTQLEDKTYVCGNKKCPSNIKRL